MEEFVNSDMTVSPVVIASPDRMGDIQAISVLRERSAPAVDLWRTLKARWLVVPTRGSSLTAFQNRKSGVE
jgi:hypothetical protein